MTPSFGKLLMISSIATIAIGIGASQVSAQAADPGDTSAPSASPEASNKDNGAISKVAWSTDDSDFTTDSTSYVNVPIISRRLKSKGPVIITFCAEAYTSRSDPNNLPGMFIQAIIDGSPVPPSSAGQNVTFEGNQPASPTNWRTARCFTWATRVDAGNHRYKIQIRKTGGEAGDIVGVDDKTLTIFYNSP